jgi:predicted RNA binding protein YcfA (HicA-like mRNA interferase family)
MMPKLPVLSPRQTVEKLKKLGFKLDHSSGSHQVLHHPDGRRSVVPFHVKDLKKGTLSAILREARIDRDEFINA